MNKITKTVGLSVMLSGAAALHEALLPKQPHANSITATFMPKVNLENTELWLSLVGLGVLGAACMVSKKINDFRNIPYKKAHDTIDDSFNVASNNKKYTKQERILILQENEFQLNKLLLKTKNYDKAAAAQFIFSNGAFLHFVENNDIPPKELVVKTKYLFDKAVSPKRYFSKLQKNYFEENPDVNFQLNYGKITKVRTGYFTQQDLPLLYDGMKNNVMLEELKQIENDVYNEEKFIQFYKYDKENLLNKIMLAKKLLYDDTIPPSNLVSEINALYRLKSLKKTIEIV